MRRGAVVKLEDIDWVSAALWQAAVKNGAVQITRIGGHIRIRSRSINCEVQVYSPGRVEHALMAGDAKAWSDPATKPGEDADDDPGDCQGQAA